MESDWKQITLGDFLELKRGYDLPKKDREDGDVPIVSSGGVSGTHAKAKVKPPGVVTGRYGTLGQVFFVEEPFWPLNTTLYVRDFKGNDPRFTSYFLRSIDFTICSDKGAVPELNRNHLHMLPIEVPMSLPEQRAIAEVLGSLDDRIELNRRMNRTLESMARALFQSRFVDDPDPAWEEKSLDEVADFLNGLALQKFPPADDEPTLPVLKIAQLRKGSTVGGDRCNTQLPEKYVVQDGDVIFSWSGSLLVRIWTGGEAALNQHLFKVTSATTPRWFHYLWTCHHLESFQQTAASKATTMGHIKRHHLTDAKVLLPPAVEMNAIGESIEALLARCVSNEIESRTLAALRDALLPRLLSGELQPTDAGGA